MLKRARAIQPSLFGIALLCFALPFANISCADPIDPAFGRYGVDVADFTGWELIAGRPITQESRQLFKDFAMNPEAVNREVFAVIAASAALAGLVLTLVWPVAWRSRLGVIAGVVGATAMVLLGLFPHIRELGLVKVTWRIGYWAALASLVLAAALGFLQQREPDSFISSEGSSPD